jgi:hypothetical protein
MGVIAGIVGHRQRGALRVPVAVGVNVTLIAQLALATTLAPRLFVCLKSPLSVPVMAVLQATARKAGYLENGHRQR